MHGRIWGFVFLHDHERSKRAQFDLGGWSGGARTEPSHAIGACGASTARWQQLHEVCAIGKSDLWGRALEQELLDSVVMSLEEMERLLTGTEHV